MKKMATIFASVSIFTVACGDDVPPEGSEDTSADESIVMSGDESASASEGIEPLPDCGDGIQDGAEECDDGNGIDNDSCTNACTLPVCGDGIVQAGEDCDDGGNENGDGCLSDCVWGGRELGETFYDNPFEDFQDKKRYPLENLVAVIRPDDGNSVNSHDIYVSGGRLGISRITKFGPDLSGEWTSWPYISKPLTMASGDGNAAVITGSSDGRAAAVDPAQDVLWHEPVGPGMGWQQPSPSVAAATGHLVASGLRDGGGGFVSRLDPESGDVKSVIYTGTMLYPISTSSSGRIWGVTFGDVKRLIEYMPNNEKGVDVEVQALEYSDIAQDDAGNVYLLGSNGIDNFALSKYSPDGTLEWTVARDGEVALGLDLLKNGAPIVAGHDMGEGIVSWYDPALGTETHRFTRKYGDWPSRFLDIAVADSGDFAVAVGSAEPDPLPVVERQIWIYKFEI